MILTCPKCATRYLIDDGEMRPEGRKVKCGACGEEWRVFPGGGADPAPAAFEPSPAAADPGPVNVAEPPVIPSPVAPPPVTPSTLPEAPVLESLFVSPITTDSKPAAKRSGLASNLLLVVVVIAVLAVAGYSFRMEIVRLAPKTAPIYSALGIPMKPPVAAPMKPPAGAAPPHG